MNNDEKNFQPVEKPDLEGLKMHMPEGDLEVESEEPVQRITNGPILILLGLLLLAVLIGMVWWYFLLQQAEAPQPHTRPTAEENNEPESTTAEAQVETMQAVSTSDEMSAIEADLEGTTLDSLDSELNAIDSELNNAGL
jgi:uncharacterized protein HemX